MPRSRFIMLGGFLGAGKTTAISRLAKVYQQRGLRVGIVTNDQATDLVDTHTLRSQGFDVSEVAGACFCCNFNELTAAAQSFRGDPLDVILAEPVGSCTDLVATVIQPLRRLFQTEFEMAPYGVLLKPSHGRRILSGEANAGFSPQAAYIFRKQLEEADFIVLNRIDELAPSAVSQLAELLDQHFPGVPQARMSARTGQGFESLVELLDQQGDFGRRILELDYDIYAAGEAELGWLNSSLRITSGSPFELDDVLMRMLERLRVRLLSLRAEIAHLKLIGLCDGQHGVANLIDNETPGQLSLASGARTQSADMIVNARVAIAPETLAEVVEETVKEVCRSCGASADIRQTQSFRPGRPTPTHRYADAL